ncbi:MAG: septation protein SpoVG family protein [Eubacterium sp.]|nr:septation protein SpoVG family protein [Eubacterium sp.]
MKYNIRINEVKSEDSQIKAFATVTFDDSLLVRNIAIVSRRDSDELFVSMPSYRTNDVTEKGEPIYRDVCNPITKEFYEEFSKNILTAYENRADISKEGMEFTKGDVAEPMKFVVKVSPINRDGSSLKGLGRIYLNDEFVISNVKLVDGKNGMFV